MEATSEAVMKCPACRGEGILAGPRICNRCRGEGVRARASETGIIKVCACGAAHNREAWCRLDRLGAQDDGEGGWLELRVCECGSSIAVALPIAAEVAA